MNKLRNIIRFIIALVFSLVFWCILVPFLFFLDWFITDDDIHVPQMAISGWKRWITFK